MADNPVTPVGDKPSVLGYDYLPSPVHEVGPEPAMGIRRAVGVARFALTY